MYTYQLLLFWRTNSKLKGRRMTSFRIHQRQLTPQGTGGPTYGFHSGTELIFKQVTVSFLPILSVVRLSQMIHPGSSRVLSRPIFSSILGALYLFKRQITWKLCMSYVHFMCRQWLKTRDLQHSYVNKTLKATAKVSTVPAVRNGLLWSIQI